MQLNIALQQSSRSAAIWHGTEHVSDAYSTVSAHLCLDFILKNHAKLKLDSIVATLWVLKKIINHNRSKFVLSKLVLTGVCCKHFMYTCMHRSCTLSSAHVECMSTYFMVRLLFNVQNSDNILLKYECQIFLFP